MANGEGISFTLPFINNVEDLSRFISLDQKQKTTIETVSKVHSFRIPRFYMDLMDKHNPSCPLWLQSVPSKEELSDKGEIDPLSEKEISATPAFLTRYPGRGVFLASSQCAMYCRFCNRRRLVGKGWNPKLHWEETFQYLEKEKRLKEVIISGGDPFMLLPDELDYVLSRLRSIGRIKTVRVSTRIPVVYPEGLQAGHLTAIGKSAPVWIVIHINHPKEVSPQFTDAIKKLRQKGCIIISQTVLLRNVNDCPYVLLTLFESLVQLGVKPYYLFQLDEVRGAMHFKVRLTKGIEIMRTLRREASGLAVPQYAIDVAGGFGKVPVDYVYAKKKGRNSVAIENLLGNTTLYRDVGKTSKCMKCGLCKPVAGSQ